MLAHTPGCGWLRMRAICNQPRAGVCEVVPLGSRFFPAPGEGDAVAFDCAILAGHGSILWLPQMEPLW